MKTRIGTIIAGLVLAAALAGGVAYATIPASDGMINGCYRTSLDDQKGQLRIVDDPASCRSNEMAIQWSQEGPQGIQGIQGIQGVQGETGATGAQGPKGDKGDTGDTGAAGTNGTNGADGEDGQPGTNGIDGVDGAPGANGTNGTDGAPGANGTNGTDGVSVTSAAEGVGPNCANGGSRFTAANGTTYACNGASGPAGTALPQAYTNTEVASSTIGGNLAAIVTRSVPAGSYVIHAQVHVRNISTTDLQVTCDINGPGQGAHTAHIPNDGFFATLRVTDVVQLSVPGEVKLICFVNSSLHTLVTAGSATLTAIAVTLMP
jgi:hypothetical protein